MAGVVVLWRDFDSSIPRSVSFLAIRLVAFFRVLAIEWLGFGVSADAPQYVRNVVEAEHFESLPRKKFSREDEEEEEELLSYPERNYLPSIVVLRSFQLPLRPPTNLCRKHNYTRVETKSLWFIEFVIDVEIQIQFKIVINFSLLASWVAWRGRVGGCVERKLSFVYSI